MIRKHLCLATICLVSFVWVGCDLSDAEGYRNQLLNQFSDSAADALDDSAVSSAVTALLGQENLAAGLGEEPSSAVSASKVLSWLLAVVPAISEYDKDRWQKFEHDVTAIDAAALTRLGKIGQLLQQLLASGKASKLLVRDLATAGVQISIENAEKEVLFALLASKQKIVLRWLHDASKGSKALLESVWRLSQQYSTSLLADGTSFEATEKIPVLDFVAKAAGPVLIQWSAVFGQASAMDCADGKSSCFDLNFNAAAQFLADKIKQWRLQQDNGKSDQLVVLHNNKTSQSIVAQSNSNSSASASDLQQVGKQNSTNAVTQTVQQVNGQIGNIDNQLETLKKQMQAGNHGLNQNDDRQKQLEELERRKKELEEEKKRLLAQQEQLRKQRQLASMKTKIVQERNSAWQTLAKEVRDLIGITGWQTTRSKISSRFNDFYKGNTHTLSNNVNVREIDAIIDWLQQDQEEFKKNNKGKYNKKDDPDKYDKIEEFIQAVKKRKSELLPLEGVLQQP